MSKYYKVKGYEPKVPNPSAPRDLEDYQLIALDIDGTLTNSDKVITEKTRKALIEAEERGIRLILASGRPIHGLRKLAEELEMDRHHGILEGCNGGRVEDAQTGQVLFERTLDYDMAVDIINHLSQFDVSIMIPFEDTLYVNDKDGYKVDYEASINNNMKVRECKDLVSAIHWPIAKILIAAEPEYLNEHIEEICAPFRNDVDSMFTADFYYEIMPKGINKATALHGLLLKLGIAPGDVMAFGDAENDREMLQLAGMGVAMQNARPKLKEVADYVTKSNDNDGVAYAVTEFTE